MPPAKLLENARSVTYVEFGKRTVALCRVHAFIAATHKVKTLGGLQHLFRENRGRRSFLPRRAVSSGKSTGSEQRWGGGRRAGDLRPS